MASPMDQSNLYSAEYIYNNVTYAVTDGMEIHKRLSTDPDYFNMYMRENINGNEAAAAEAATPETPEISESEECNPTDNTFEWKKQNVLLLLDAYRQRLQKFRDPKVKKKNLWMEIVHQFNNHGCRNVSIEILDRKMRNMKKTYRDIRDKNKKTGSGRVAWEYFDTFESIFADDRTINFGHTISSRRLVGIPPPPPLPPLAHHH